MRANFMGATLAPCRCVIFLVLRDGRRFYPQVNVGNKYNREAGLSDSCSSRQGDFQSLPFEDAEFDAAYQIEATCHSPDKVTTVQVMRLSNFHTEERPVILHEFCGSYRLLYVAHVHAGAVFANRSLLFTPGLHTCQ